MLSWIPPIEDDINGVVTGYIVSVLVQETQVTFTLNTSTTNVSLTQLHPYYTHHCSVTCITVTEGPYSDIVSIKTLPDGNNTNIEVLK